MKLGFKQGFSNEANFRGISDEELKIDEVIHKAFIEAGLFGNFNNDRFKKPRAFAPTY